MIERFTIAGYARISVDDELNQENTSIENQKAIISDFVKQRFPESELVFYEDRDKSGYTFEQRDGYQRMRRKLMAHQIDILIVKDFSRFSRRNSRGLVELEDLRDAGVRIISIGDGIDYPNDDDWLKIQFQFLINEMPVTDTSKKVRAVVRRRQEDGKWICAAPYGYIVTESQQFEIVPTEAEIVRLIYQRYLGGWGYKRIANSLTDEGIPTPRMSEKTRVEMKGREYHRKCRPEWSIISVQTILTNDFYIGTLRQGKYYRKKINGKDVKRDEDEHIVLENHHQPIIDYRTFATVKDMMDRRAASDYTGIKKNENAYTGFLRCGDCGSPMFTMSRATGVDAYHCGAYHRRGLKACTSHYTKTSTLDELLKMYLKKVRDNAQGMIDKLNGELSQEEEDIDEAERSVKNLTDVVEDLQEELKATKRQRIRDLMKHPEQAALLEETYDEMESSLVERITGLQNQITLNQNRRNLIIRVNRKAKTALQIFDEILEKDHLDTRDLGLLVEEILIYTDHIDVKLKADIDALLNSGTVTDAETGEAVNFKRGTKGQVMLLQRSKNTRNRAFCVNTISDGDPLEIYTDRDGEVILKKYSPIGEMSSFAKDYTESLFRSLGHIACIVDRDQVVAASGVSKKELWDKPISPDLESAIQARQTVTSNRTGGGKIVPVTNEEDVSGYTAQVVSPIIADGEAIGAVLLLSREQGARMGDTEIKVAETAAGIVGRQMEQ
ncbi:MAG: stage V sporulation T C-terminal domain-containing protein [Clostridia bacterium]|nr:stage V sporulation T C-terminal domain-containing protein [Clostridia bacterium]